MKVRLQGVRKIRIEGEYIKLDSLLKFASIASTGGEAKLLTQNGEVYVDGTVCLQRGRKIRPGEVVKCRVPSQNGKRTLDTLLIEAKNAMVGNDAHTENTDRHIAE